MSKRSSAIAAKRSKNRHALAGYPVMASPMDVADHPVHNLPNPAGGLFNPAQLMAPGAPLAPGEAI